MNIWSVFRPGRGKMDSEKNKTMVNDFRYRLITVTTKLIDVVVRLIKPKVSLFKFRDNVFIAWHR